jgi:diguanylate cyclase (GGDEF)-like protein
VRVRSWLIFLILGAAASAVCQFTPAGIVADVGYVVIGIAGVVAVMVGLRLHRPARRWPWYFMAAGQLLWVIGDAIDSWQVDVAHTERFPGPDDALYLAAYPLLAVGLVLLIRARRPRRDVAGLLDSALLTIALGLLSWVILTRPVIEASGQSHFAAAVSLAYPAADILLLGVMIRLITTAGGRTPSLRLLLTAVALLITADTTASALGLLTSADSGSVNFLWLMSYVVWGAAALHPSMHSLSEPAAAADIRFTRTRLAVLALAVLVAPGTLVVELVVRSPLDGWAIAVGSVAMSLLVVGRLSVVIRDITTANAERERVQNELAHQADHDSLTGLANRAQAMRLILGALSRSQRSGELVGLLFLDLDGFKAINDTLGHAAGDQVLTAVARRLEVGVRGGDTVARLGGDEFVVLLEPLDQMSSAVEAADRLVVAVSAPITLTSGREVSVGTSIGVALSQDGTTEPDKLLHEADVAVYRAKTKGRGRTEVFDRELREELEHQAELEAVILAAINGDELVLRYQPIVHLPTGTVNGYEALVRWARPGVGLLSTEEFIPVAERSELICELDCWVLQHATTQLSMLNRRSRSMVELTVAVNISGRHIGRRRIINDVETALRNSGVEPHQLVLEITDTAAIDDESVLVNIQSLRDMGVAISLDAGTAYNFIGRLDTLPVDIMKIDKRFLDETTPSADKLLRLLVQSAHAFNLPVVAEGVEHQSQLDILRSIDCDSAQGYLLGRPLDPIQINTRNPVVRLR